MQRYKLVVGGTLAGIAGVLAFPTRSTHLSIPVGTSSGSSSAAPAATGGSSGTGTSSSGTGSSSSGTGSSSGTRSATSADQSFRYGDLAVTVAVSGSRITKVSMATINETDGRSVAIDSYAIPQLEQQVISAGSVNINGVSGATFTSQAFVDAVANAMGKLGLKA